VGLLAVPSEILIFSIFTIRFHTPQIAFCRPSDAFQTTQSGSNLQERVIAADVPYRKKKRADLSEFDRLPCVGGTAVGDVRDAYGARRHEEAERWLRLNPIRA
jgi:hypothetical protein